MEQLTNSELLPSWWDESYYLYKNPDVAAEVKKGSLESGYKHFVEYGIKEGRDPNSGFNTRYYLDKNLDVAEAVRNGTIASAFEHWLLYGQQENRQAAPDRIIIPQQNQQKLLLDDREVDSAIPLTSLTKVLDKGLIPISDPSLEPPKFIEGSQITLRADETNAFTKVLPPVSFTSEPEIENSTINVTYNGFTPEAQAAFEYAVDIWESLIESPVPIEVVANWTPLGSGILGSAGPNYLIRDFSGAPTANTWYAAALANKLAGADLDTSETDITANFNSNFSNWYLGTDANTPAGQYDFVSVVLHELGHGLGFLGSMWVDGDQGSWGGGTPYPDTYDRFAVNGSNQSLIDTTLFANPSVELANELQSDNLFFNGSNAVAGNNGNNPKLYAPATWQPGSSYSHLDEATYTPGNINSLMTPAFSAAEAIHNPGPITLGIFKDTGWTVDDTVGPVNDYFVDRITLANRSTTGTNVNGTKETGEPNHGGNLGGKSVWWSWTAPASGKFTLSTAGSDFDTLLGLYTGSDVAGLTEIGGNDDSNDTWQSQVTFDAVAGTAYQIAVDGYNYGSEAFSGNIALQLAPTNDNFVNLFTLSGSSASVIGSNVFASKESGEPNHANFLGGKSVWWSWTAPYSGNVTFSTAGSNFDTLLGVYTGANVAGLNLIAGNDDSNGTYQSQVTFNAVAGTDYKIAVDGYGSGESASAGAIALNLEQDIPETGEIHGLKWNDLDGDSTRDPEEAGLSGWTIYLDQNQNGVLDTGETSATTDSSGNYAFTGLAAGTYTVAEVMQEGWEQTYPNVSDESSTEPIAISTTNSPVPISTYGEIVKSSTDEEINPLTDVSGPLINLDEFRADPRFAGINGNGFSTVILDTGIDLNHSYFGPDNNADGVADRIVYQYDFANGDADASDHDGHGSNVSSIVASSDSVHTGMAPGADIIHLKVFEDSGAGYFSYIEQALQWVVANADTYKIASVNMSLGDSQNWNTGQTLYGISDEIAALAAKDVMVVSAAGNDFYGFGSAQGVSYPAADPNSLAVGASYDSNAGGFTYSSGAQAYTTGADRITPFSQRHSTLTSIFAPGAPITGAGPTGGTVTFHGTSQAAPHIAGIAALAQQLAEQTIDRRLTLDEFQNLLSTTGVTINDGDDEDDNVTNTGLNFKRVDVMALGEAILAMDDDTPPGTHTVHLNPGEVVTGKDFGNKLSDDSSPFINPQTPNWKVQATKDFNGDGKGDIFWRDESNGNNQLWLMNGRTVSSSENINVLSPNWEVQGVNDFNGDSKADILWRDPATGQNTLWLMDGSTVNSDTAINPAAINWQVEATDDFNGDGKADIFWHDPVTGQNALWLMDGSTRIDSGNFSGARTAWQVKATDDFNDDGKADILWRNASTGQNSIWLMDGLSVITGRNITGARLNWEVESTDDFNSDGKADIVWRDVTTGENQVWLVDGTTVTSLENISSAASNWQIQGTSDFNNDSNSDILWRDPATGQNAMWLMNGLNNPTGPLLV